jgi:epoxyqueuosine reductase
VEILALDEAAFRERYSGTSFMRARWDGMRRNACLVLGNRRRADAVPSLARTLHDPDPMLRGHAAWALGRIGGADAERALREAGRNEPDPGVLAEIRRARSGGEGPR